MKKYIILSQVTEMAYTLKRRVFFSYSYNPRNSDSVFQFNKYDITRQRNITIFQDHYTFFIKSNIE